MNQNRKPESWLEPRETRGWGCDNCDLTGRGWPAAACPRCGHREFYRVGISECPRREGFCADGRCQLVDGLTAHVRIG